MGSGKTLESNISKKIGLIAGDGELPIKLAQSASKKGHEVICVSLSPTNQKELTKCCGKTYSSGPGEIEKILSIIKNEEIKELSFIGKVHKGMLLRNPRLDKKAISLIMQKKKLNDDEIMLTAVEELEKEGIHVIDQSIFLQDLLVPQGILGRYEPDEEQKSTIEYGFNIAKEMGRLDIGQTVVVKNRMILAIEAIEGTDKAIERGCRLARADAIVVKVSKPNQDKRFDIPTVGMNTLKMMKKYRAKILAVEAGETFIAQKEEMIKFADENKMVFIAV